MKYSSVELSGEGLVGAALASYAGHWLITPARHPHATAWQSWLAAAGLIAGIGLFLFAVVAYRRERAAEAALLDPPRDSSGVDKQGDRETIGRRL